jgi:hypothetical protein
MTSLPIPDLILKVEKQEGHGVPLKGKEALPGCTRAASRYY